MTTQYVKDSASANDAVTGTLPISEQGIGVQLNSGSSRRDISLPAASSSVGATIITAANKRRTARRHPLSLLSEPYHFPPSISVAFPSSTNPGALSWLRRSALLGAVQHQLPAMALIRSVVDTMYSEHWSRSCASLSAFLQRALSTPRPAAATACKP